MRRAKYLLTLTLSMLFLQAYALIPTEQKQRLTAGWEFIRQDMGSIWEVMRPITGAGKPETVPLWKSVTLPHCFNAEDAVDPDLNYYQGAGWYRTTLQIEQPFPNGRIYLEFEGAGQKSEVYLYTTLIGSHTGGYDEWKVDLTEAVEQFRHHPEYQSRFGGRIPIAIRCDNSRDTEMIPSDMSDFTLYGGLYRYVNLVYTPQVHWESVHIQATTDEKGKRGHVTVQLQPAPIRGERVAHPEDYRMDLRIIAPDGKEVKHLSPTLTSLSSTSSYTLSLNRPALWSPDTPNCYQCHLTLTGGGDTLRTIHTFGFRHFRFEPHGPFYLNGQRLPLRGTHRHEDHAGVGAALTEAMMRAEMKQIKAMGANFIRLGHYQQSDIILRLCDELGLLVWEEIPWCRGGLGGNQYKQQALRMLTNQIEQHYNHPSIILWGLGNENDWPGDFETTSPDSIRAFMQQLHQLAHRLDSTRLTVIRRCDFCKDLVDVYSPSIWAGWYSRRFRDYRQMEEAAINSNTRFIHAEWGGDSHAGRHTEAHTSDGQTTFDIQAGDRNGDWSESYIIRLFDWHLKEQEQMPQLTGSAFWTFKDFATPLRPTNPIPYVNQKGVVQRDGTPKESYYVFQSYWSSEPMIHLYGHSWPVRWGQPGERKEVLVYSNCPEVELFVNGISQGKRRRNSQDFPAAGLHWQVVFQEGENRLEAVAHHGKQQLHDSIIQHYQTAAWGEAADILLHQRVLPSGHLLIEAEVVDKQGIRCLDADTWIAFDCTDSHAILQNQGTTRGSRLIQAANGRACIEVKPVSHDVVVSVSNKEHTLPTRFLSVPSAK